MVFDTSKSIEAAITAIQNEIARRFPWVEEGALRRSGSRLTFCDPDGDGETNGYLMAASSGGRTTVSLTGPGVSYLQDAVTAALAQLA